MNILWDFRLFSHGYRDRGVGVFATRMAKAILDADFKANIFIWGKKEDAPEEMHTWPVRWIPYKPRSWKSDLLVIPMLIIKYRIDIFHYWVALGPVFRIGLGLFHPCKTCLVVHDCGVLLWDDVPQCLTVRKTWYWKTQRYLFGKANSVVCISHATLSDVKRLFKCGPPAKRVIYVPLHGDFPKGASIREKRFVMVSGPYHKNAKNVLKAFEFFKQKHPEYKLSVYGDCLPEGITLDEGAGGVRVESMNGYDEGLATSSGLLFCSFHEGLGLPPLEAMAHGCPLVLSDLPVLHETCGDAGFYVDPRNIPSILHGMEDLACNQDLWTQKSWNGGVRYRGMSENAGKEWLTLYNGLA
jgi:glycosyltransferase involved in cell wall biosynthesis